jgi:hypothetical protein
VRWLIETLNGLVKVDIMGNVWFNMRIVSWHIQIKNGSWFPRVSYNGHHKEMGYPDGYFSLYWR